MRFDYPIEATILVTSTEQLQAVYAVLAGQPSVVTRVITPEQAADEEFMEGTQWPQSIRPVAENHKHEPADYELAEAAEQGEVYPETQVDSAGVPFDPELHTGTKTKDGKWRMKKGATVPRAENLDRDKFLEPGGDENSARDVRNAVNEADDDDEFAAFREAATASTDTAPAEVPARTWSDADLASLCNQAVTKLGGPSGVAPVKELIAKFTPEGEVPHSRHIPIEQREEFAQAVEAAAKIEFAG